MIVYSGGRPPSLRLSHAFTFVSESAQTLIVVFAASTNALAEL
jgi:hypothetical protein